MFLALIYCLDITSWLHVICNTRQVFGSYVYPRSYNVLQYVTSHTKTHTNGFLLNGLSHWLPIGDTDESVEGVGNAIAFFSLSVEGVEKSHWENLSHPLKDS